MPILQKSCGGASSFWERVTLAFKVEFFFGLLTRSKCAGARVFIGSRTSRCKIKKNWRATADEDGHYSLAIPL
jgi:hypothetical protein